MNVKPNLVGKLNSELQHALTQADQDTSLRVIMHLGSGEDESMPESKEPEFDPTQFPSRREYRQALIDQQKVQVSKAIGGTLNKLRDLALSVHGGEIGQTVVVEGPARQIVKALELPGVHYAFLDQPITL